MSETHATTTTPTIAIRRATASDLEAIVGMLADDELGSTRENPADLAPYEAAFARIEADPNQLLAVMERDGAVIGTLQLTFIPGLSFQGAIRAQIEAVRVASGERGGGLGKQLINWAIEQARQRGAKMVQLSSNSTRIDAHRFYRNLGFDQSHTGFKLSLTPASPALGTPEISAGATCDPELGICTFEGDALPDGSGNVAAPNISALSGLGASPDPGKKSSSQH